MRLTLSVYDHNDYLPNTNQPRYPHNLLGNIETRLYTHHTNPSTITPTYRTYIPYDQSHLTREHQLTTITIRK